MLVASSIAESVAEDWALANSGKAAQLLMVGYCVLILGLQTWWLSLSPSLHMHLRPSIKSQSRHIRLM